MFVCLCNVLTDAQVREAASAGAVRPSEIYQACGCAAQCGRCAPTLLRIANERPVLEGGELLAAD